MAVAPSLGLNSVSGTIAQVSSGRLTMEFFDRKARNSPRLPG
jgi:hypothetical protein